MFPFALLRPLLHQYQSLAFIMFLIVLSLLVLLYLPKRISFLVFLLGLSLNFNKNPYLVTNQLFLSLNFNLIAVYRLFSLVCRCCLYTVLLNLPKSITFQDFISISLRVLLHLPKRITFLVFSLVFIIFSYFLNTFIFFIIISYFVMFLFFL